MNASAPPMPDALAQLRDLHLPAEPSWFPPAPGWWMLAALLVVAAAVVVARRIARRRRRAPFRAARDELAVLRSATDAGSASPVEFADGASAILKRVAIHGLHRPEAAALVGDGWLMFLDRLGGSDAFSRGAGAALGSGRFAPRASVDHAALDACVRDLLERWERAA